MFFVLQIKRLFKRFYVLYNIGEDREIARKILEDCWEDNDLSVMQDNEHCPCDSGLEYKDCCKKHHKKADSRKGKNKRKIPINILIPNRFNEIKNEIKTCLYPDRHKCSETIINAHAIQNRKVLSLLANKDNCVLMVDLTKKANITWNKGQKPDICAPFIKVICAKATTQLCFCSYHDAEVFKHIENKSIPFDCKDKEMLFLYAYRAFIFEFAKCRISVEAEKRAFKENYPNIDLHKWAIGYHAALYRLNKYREVKKEFDACLLSKKYDKIIACIRVLPYKLGFAVYSFIAPLFDLNGNRIDGIKSNSSINKLSLWVFPEENQSFILLCCLKHDIRVYSKLFKQIEREREERVLLYFNHLLPLYSENIVFSEKLWNSFSDIEKKTIENSINCLSLQERLLKTLRFGKILRITLKKPWSPCGKVPNLFKTTQTPSPAPSH